MPSLFVRPVVHDDSAPTIDLQKVSVAYDGAPALEEISLQVKRGDRVAVVGPNGAGKSTLFNVIAGIIKADRGVVRVYGAGPRGHICVGYVPQRNRVDWRFPVTVTDVVMMGRVGKMGLLGWPRQRDRRKVAEALEQVDMHGFAKRQIGELSGGQQQRVFLARALAQEAEVLLLDEPLAGLDLPSQEAIMQTLADLGGEGITILVATHDLAQASTQFPLIMLLNRVLVAYGAPSQVLTPQTMSRAYGNQMHVIHSAQGDVMVADDCCDGGRLPVKPLFGLPVHDEALSSASALGRLPTEKAR